MTEPVDPLDVIEALLKEERTPLEDKQYPGSKRLRVAFRKQEEVAPSETPTSEDDWDAKPYIVAVVHGVQTPLFTIGSLAMAMERSPNTIRDWERFGIIPKAPYEKGSGRGKRRLYSRAHIVGMMAIAEDEGILVPPGRRVRDFTETDFTEKVVALWEAISRIS